ncbi:hypothetical protein [Paraburkholderia atlantica]|uniref:hypothetical protein n=1 Tax=Paraburkholderia atlantica TaxID=2654982 RepID=UPI001610A98D|nr:hypothetical protein [Paraburkholderia atlantica]MBB5510644.1 hypothetical protein [Paraburkholderia atlantica]
MTDIQLKKQQARAILASEKSRVIQYAGLNGIVVSERRNPPADSLVILQVEHSLALALIEAGEFDERGMLKP